MSLWDMLASPPAPNARLRVWEEGCFRGETWATLVTRAERFAVGLRARGVAPGTHVACVLTNTFDVCAGLLGIWLAGGVVVSLPTPTRGSEMVDYAAQLARFCAAADSPLLLLEDAFAQRMPETDGLRIDSFERIGADGPLVAEPPAADAPAFVQYSSGSTSVPKGCVLTPRAIAAQLGMLLDRLDGDPATDAAYSWLPLSHDMGLFGGLMTPWAGGGPLTLSSPLRFLRSPRTWLDDCANAAATYTVGPNFGLRLVVRAARRWPPAGRLKLRTWIIGSDPIEADSVDRALEVLEPFGMLPTTLRPAYGMAEATLSVTMTPARTRPFALPVALDALYDGRVEAPAPDEPSAGVVSCGPPVAGTRVRIDGPAAVGEICVSSMSLASGYLNDRERSERAFSNGELRTGDVGFLRGGELFVIGRQDDMMSINGRNVPAGEIESRLGDDPRIRNGTCVLVDVHTGGRRQLVVLSEPAAADADLDDAARNMRRVAASVAGVGIDECVFLQRGAVPKGPSGKVQRFRCRQLAGDSDAPTVARIRVA